MKDIIFDEGRYLGLALTHFQRRHPIRQGELWFIGNAFPDVRSQRCLPSAQEVSPKHCHWEQSQPQHYNDAFGCAATPWQTKIAIPSDSQFICCNFHLWRAVSKWMFMISQEGHVNFMVASNASENIQFVDFKVKFMKCCCQRTCLQL